MTVPYSREGERARAQLRDYQQRLAQSEATLKRAQRDREKTEELRIEAVRQAEENRQALDRLQTAGNPPPTRTRRTSTPMPRGQRHSTQQTCGSTTCLYNRPTPSLMPMKLR